MKNIVMMIVSAMLGIIMLAIVMSVSGRMNRSLEQHDNLSSAAEETLAAMAATENYSFRNGDEFTADFIENLSAILETDSDIEVKIMKADEKKGVLSMKVIQTFLHPNGRKGSAVCNRTVILNRIEDEEAGSFMIRFYRNKEDMIYGNQCYKQMMVWEGNGIVVPTDPVEDGKSFVVWKDINDYIADFTQPAEQDISYYAEWK